MTRKIGRWIRRKTHTIQIRFDDFDQYFIDGIKEMYDDGNGEFSQREIAEIFGISQSRVCKMVNSIPINARRNS